MSRGAPKDSPSGSSLSALEKSPYFEVWPACTIETQVAITVTASEADSYYPPRIDLTISDRTDEVGADLLPEECRQIAVALLLAAQYFDDELLDKRRRGVVA